MDHSSKPGSQSRKFPVGNPTKRGGVLRAADVIPPFTANTQPPEDGLEIPSYDLAQNILAEQRQAAGQRRRGPGQAGADPCARSDAAGQPRGAAPADLASQDLRDLQRVVAEIVARDIERLCRKPDRLSARGCAARFA